MASEEEAVAEETCNTEMEEETLALQKKRSRRVSFAETTAIHIFDRDEEYDTPPDPKPGSDGGESPANEDQWLRRTESDEINELLQSDEEDNGCDADDDDEVVRSSFLRPIESPSPGSYFGSATSNDADDNYFGPVSVDFIKPRQLSDSAASDDNHDITMDSTVFSMHFRSLAKSDSGAECKTPTGMYLAFEDRTPSQTKLTDNVGNSMVLTGAKKPFLQSSLPDGKQSAGDSNDMSLVGENPHKYDYGKLSPGLDALLSPDHNNIQADSPSYHAEVLSLGTHSGAEDKLPTLLGNKHGIQKLVDKIPSESVSPIAMNIDEADRSIETIGQQPSFDCSKKDHLVTKGPTDGQLGTPNQQSKDILTVKGIISDEGTSEAGSISSLYAKRRHIFSDANNSSHHRWDSTPLRNIPCSFNRRESAEDVRSLVSFEKSSSRLERPEHFPFASTSKIVKHSRLMFPHHVSRSPIRALVKESRIDNQINHVTAPIVRLEDQFTSIIVDEQEERSISNRDINDLRTFENGGSVRDSEDVDVVRHGTSSYSPTWLCSHDSNSEQFNATASPPRFELSRENALENLLSTTNYTEGVLHSMRSDLSSQEITLNDKKYQDAADTYEDKIHSLEQGLKSKGSGSEKHEESISTDLYLQDNFEGKRDGAANECTSLNADVENCDSHFHEKMSEIGVSSIDTESFDGFAQVSKSIDQDILVNNPQSTSFQDGDFGAYAFCSSNHSVQASKELTSSVKICECPSKEELQSSPSRKDLSILSGDNNPHIFVGTSLASPKSNQLMKEPVKSGINQSGPTLHLTSSLCHHDSASKLKRKCGELAHGGKGRVDETDEVAFVQPSPKLLRDQRHDAVPLRASTTFLLLRCSVVREVDLLLKVADSSDCDGKEAQRMFKKAAEAKSLQRLSGADKKKLRRTVKDKFPRASDADVDYLLPYKAEVIVAKFQNRVLVYGVEGGFPMFFDTDGRGSEIYPTVFALWKAPDILPAFMLKGGEVSRFIIGGADLMFPGISIPAEGLPSFLAGEPWAVKVPGNPAPIAVGATTMSSTEAFKAGLRGKALRVTHYYHDSLWESVDGHFVPNAGFLNDVVYENPAASSLVASYSREDDALNERYVAVGSEEAINAEGAVPASVTLLEDKISEQVARGIGDMSITNTVSVDEPTFEEQQSLSAEDVDALLDKYLLQALHTSVKDKDLPIPGSTLWSNHILPCRPLGVTLDIKKSSFKKLSKWLQSRAYTGMISVKEDKYKKETILLSVNRNHLEYTSFKPEKRNTDETDQTNHQAATECRSLRLLEVEEVYKPSVHVHPIFSSVGADTVGLYSASEASEIVFKYIEKENLVKLTDKSLVILDAMLCDALFKGTVKKGSTYPTEIHKRDLGCTFVNRMQAHHKVTRGPETLVRKGAVKSIRIMTERRQGNKKVTKVSGFEIFLMNAESLASELQKKFACSTSVAELPGKKGFEVLVQGGVIDHLAKHLVEQYGVPKRYIEVLDKTRK